MTELIIKVLQGGASAAELRSLQEWRLSSPENERFYQDVVRVWQATAAGDIKVGTGRELDPDEIARRATTPRRTTIIPFPRETVPSPPAWRRRGLVAAAILVLAIAIGQPRSEGDSAFFAGTEVRTEEGETTTVQLADGSFVRLAPHSRLQFDRGRNARHVWLEGRAFFAVAHAAQPFTVGTALGEAVVLGTRFDLNTHDDDLALLVVDGRVALSSAGQRVELTRGELSVSSGGTAMDVRQVDDVLEYLDWMGRSLLFQATPLAEVVREVERTYDAEVVIEDASIANRTFTASFTNRSFNEVMDVVCEVLSLTCTIDEIQARIHGGEPSSPGPVQVAPQPRR